MRILRWSKLSFLLIRELIRYLFRLIQIDDNYVTYFQRRETFYRCVSIIWRNHTNRLSYMFLQQSFFKYLSSFWFWVHSIVSFSRSRARWTNAEILIKMYKISYIFRFVSSLEISSWKSVVDWDHHTHDLSRRIYSRLSRMI
jgi:hypothetical protein